LLTLLVKTVEYMYVCSLW